MICCRKQCKSNRPGVWEPVLLLWGERHAPDTHQPASVSVRGALVCDECKNDVRAIDFLDRKMWSNIKNEFIAQGKMVPSLATSKVVLVLPESLSLGGYNV